MNNEVSDVISCNENYCGKTQSVLKTISLFKQILLAIIFCCFFVAYATASPPPPPPPSITGPSTSETGEIPLSFPPRDGATNGYGDVEIWAVRNGDYNNLIAYDVGGNTSITINVTQTGSWEFHHIFWEYVTCDCVEPPGWLPYSVGTHAVTVTNPPIGTPGAISLPSTSNNGNYEVAWGGSSGPVTRYELQEKVNSGGFSTIHNASSFFLSKVFAPEFENTKGNGTYTYQVRGCNALRCSNWRTSTNYKIDVAITPGTPSSISVSPITSTNGEFNISWGLTSGYPSYYRLYRQKNGGSWGNHIVQTATIAFNDTNNGNTLGDGTYRYRVEACKQVGSYTSCGGYQTSPNRTVLKVPGIPGNFTGPSYGISLNGQFTLSWNQASGTVHRYELEERNGGGWYPVPLDNNLDRFKEFDASDARPDGSYEYRVRACNINCSNWSTPIGVGVLRTPGVPGGLNAPDSDTGNYTISWNTATGSVGSYRIQENNGSGWGWEGAGYLELGPTTTSVNISGHTDGSYNYRVAACNIFTCSAYSSLQTSDVSIPPGTPSSISVSPGVTNQNVFTITWGASSGGAQDYRIERQYNSGSWGQIDVVATSPRTYTDTVDNAGNYRYRVRACKRVGSNTSCSGRRTAQNDVIFASPPEFTIINAPSVLENPNTNTFARFAVTKNGPTGQPYSVSYATAEISNISNSAIKDSDYSHTTGILTFDASAEDEIQYVEVPILDNNAFEMAEKFEVRLSNPSNGATLGDQGRDVAEVIINDDESPPDFSVVISTSSYPEGDSLPGNNITVTIRASNPTEVPMIIDYFTTVEIENGDTATEYEDFTPIIDGTVTFEDGVEPLKYINVPITPDLIYEGDETFTFNIAKSPDNSPTIAPLIDIMVPQATQTIQNDDDPPIFSITGGSSSEGTSITFNIKKTGLSAFEHVVSFDTVDNGNGDFDAVAGSDYESKSATRTFSASDTESITELTVKINTIEDSLFEHDESFSVVLSQPTNGATLELGQDSATGIIENDEDSKPRFTVNDLTDPVIEGGTATFTITKTGTTGLTHVINYAVVNGSGEVGSDYENLIPGSLSFALGITSRTVDVEILDNDNLFELPENFALNISSADPNVIIDDNQGLATINDNDPAPEFSVNDVEVTEGGQLQFTVTKTNATSLSHSVNVLTVDGTTNGNDYESVNTTLTFLTGDTSLPVIVNTTDDNFGEGDETVRLRLSNATNGSVITDNEGVGTIIDNDSMPPDTPPGPIGKPTPPDSGISDTVGALAGEFRVDESGSATYTIPIATPAGTAGVAPQVALSYNSQAGNSLLGQGWGISGLSAISRCRPTLSQDRYTQEIAWNETDRFCLDGQRLIVAPGYSYGQVGAIYTTEIDGFNRIQSHGGSLGRPQYFTVINKDGSIRYFGNTANSREQTSDGQYTLNWTLNRMEDSVGNGIDYIYYNDTNGHRIRTIEYAFGAGASANARVEFIYGSRADVKRGYISGYEFNSLQRLERIEVFNDGVNIREYQLNYQQLPPEYRRNTSYLNSVTECVSGICRQPTTFSWTSSTVGFSGTRIPAVEIPIQKDQALTDFAYGDINGDGCLDMAIAKRDFDDNGDHDDRISYYMSDCQRLTQTAFADGAMEYDTGYEGVKVKLLDYNLDGFDDFFYLHPRDGWRVHLAKPSPNRVGQIDAHANHINFGFPWETDFGDFNSDGLVDAITWRDGVLDLRLLEVNPNESIESDRRYRFSAPIVLDAPMLTDRIVNSIQVVGDLNGDGIMDVAMETRPVLSPECNFACVLTRKFQYFIVGENSIELFSERDGEADPNEKTADINGDGLVDLIINTDVQLNRGDGTLASAVTANLTNNKINFIDYNGDGYQDLINKNGQVALWNPSNNNFDSAFSIIFPSLDGNDDALYTDINGDGKLDLITLMNRRTFGTQLGLAFDIPNPQINHIATGLGNEVGIDYDLLIESDHYSGTFTPAGTSQSDINAFYADINGGWDLPSGTQTLGKLSPTINLLGPMNVVVRVSQSAPAGNANTESSVNVNALSHINYRYREAKLQAGGRGILGFEALTSVDEQTGVETTTTYRQDWPFIGMPQETTTRTASGHLLNKATNTWRLRNWSTVQPQLGAVQTVGTRVLRGLQPFLYSSVEESYDLVNNGANAGNLLTTVTTTTTMDNFGNPTDLQVRIEGNGDWFEKTTTNEYGPGFMNLHGESFTYAQLGRLTRTDVTSSRSDDYDATPQIRSSAFTYYTTGANTGMLRTEVIEPDNPAFRVTTTYQYDAFGNQNAITTSGLGVANRTAQSVYDSTGRYMNRSINALGQVTQEVLQRNNLGLPTQVANIDGVRSYTDYGAFGDPIQQYSQTGAWSQTLRYDCNDGTCPTAAETYVHTSQAGGGEAIAYIDSLGRTVREATLHFDGSWTYVDTEYDNIGRVLRVSEPYAGSGAPQFWTQMQYDILGRTVRTDMPGIANPMLMSYSGYSSTTTNMAGQTKSELKNAMGDLIQVTDNIGGTISYAYDAQSNLRQVHQQGNGDAPNAPIYICYDQQGRKIAMRDPDKGGHVGGNTSCPTDTGTPQTGWWLYSYNVYGELTDQIDAKGQLSHIDYDVLGRTVNRIDYRANSTIEGNTTWAYNNGLTGSGRGQLDYVTDSVSGYIKMVSYDGFGRVDTTSTNLGGNGDDNHYERITYDQFGRTFQIFDAAGDGSFQNSGIQHHYNAEGYLAQISNANPVDGGREYYHSILSMDRRGRVDQSLKGNGLTTTHFYDPATGRLDDILTEFIPGVQTVQDSHYEWDDLGNLTLRREQGADKNVEETFDYDPLNRLDSAQVSGQSEQTITYNSLGNITSKSGVGTYYYRGNCGNGGYGIHAVCETGDGIQYQYDANGNLTNDTAAGGAGGRGITYTTFDKPSVITKGSHTTTFAYGPGRSRFLRTDSNAGGTTTTRYIGNVEKITNPDGSQEIRRYLPGGTLITISLDDNGNQIDRDTMFRYMDHLGSLDVVTDSVGEVEASYSFDAWGQRRNSLNWANLTQQQLQTFDHSLTTRGFTGHEMLDEVGLVHMNGRIYDARIGRFVQADTFVDGAAYTQGYNRYTYTYNNPLNATDPTGHFVGAALGAALPVYGHIGMQKSLGPKGAAINTTIGSMFCGPWFALCYGGGTATDAKIFGASHREAITAGVKAGVTAYISQAAFSAVGGYFDGSTALRAEGGFFHIAAHGVVGGVMSVVQGGKFGHGFVSAGFSKFATRYIQDTSWDYGNKDIGQAMQAAIIGGTASAIVGGKFANGAITAAFGNLYNQQGSSRIDVLAKDQNGNPIFNSTGNIVNPDPRGTRTGITTSRLEEGYLEMADGTKVKAYKNLSTDARWDYDCHGFSIAEGKYWIDDSDMQGWLQSQNLLAKTQFPTLGDLVVYRVGGNVVHSAIISGRGQVTMAAGTMVWNGSHTTTVPIRQGWTAPGTTIEYWEPKP